MDAYSNIKNLDIENIKQKIEHIVHVNRWFYGNYVNQIDNQHPLDLLSILSNLWKENISVFDDKFQSLKHVGYDFDLSNFKKKEDWGDDSCGDPVYAYIDQYGTIYEDWNFSINFAANLLKKYNTLHDKKYNIAY